MNGDINNEIDHLLAELRPDRYEVDGGDEWLDLVAAGIQPLIPESEARAIAARQMVGRRETQKLKNSNRILRDIYDSKQLPLDWMDTLNWPISVGKERVAIRAATPEDFRQFAINERRRAANDFTARNATCEAAEWLADVMDGNGVGYGRDLDL